MMKGGENMKNKESFLKALDGEEVIVIGALRCPPNCNNNIVYLPM